MLLCLILEASPIAALSINCLIHRWRRGRWTWRPGEIRYWN